MLLAHLIFALPFQVKLIESFTSVLESAGVMYADEDEEGDFVVKLSKLVCIVCVIIVIVILGVVSTCYNL